MIDHLIQQHGQKLFGLCLKLCAHRQDAEDLYQETWIKAYRALDRYDPDKGAEGWLTAICVNAYRDLLRRSKWKGLFHVFGDNEQKELALRSVPAPPPDEEAQELRQAIDRLPDRDRTIILMHYFWGFGVKETAESLNMPEGTVKYRLGRAREQLKRRLSAHG